MQIGIGIGLGNTPTPFSPPRVSGLDLWLDADSGNLHTDKSSSARTVSEIGGALTLNTADADFNGHNSVSGVAGRYLKIASDLGANGSDVGWTIAATIKASGLAVEALCGFGNATSGTSRHDLRVASGPTWTSTRVDSSAASADAASGITAQTSPHVLVAVFSGTSLAWYRDGVAGSAPAQNVGTFSVDSFLVFARYLAAASAGNVFTGKVANFMHWPRALTTAERGQIESYCKARYATP